MIRVLFIIPLFIVLSQIVTSQDFASELTKKSNEVAILRNISVSQDPRIEKMLRWHIENNKIKDGLDGYLVEIFFSSAMNARGQAMREKVEFLSKYPDYNVHVIYSAPNFRVRIGDFRTKSEALKLLKTIQSDYPGAFIVPGIIDFPLLNQDKNE
ncbi:MAG: SPOR domain-containing protein [Prolixibacteraceae bacterium]|nr:SPOR domain-containing protein [Prolixibacteraceae bacterium]